VATHQAQQIAQPVATFAKSHKPMSSTDAEGWSPVDAAPTVTHWPRDRSDAGTDVAVVYERHDQDARVKEVSVAPTLHSKSDNICDLPMVQAAMQVRRPLAAGAHIPAVAFEENFQAIREVDVAPAMTTHGYRVSQNAGGLGLSTAMQVRRLTPVECERLQGFPDNFTNIPWRGKAEAPDGPRYKALGNSMAVPVMRWIGERINA
jgi:site-specific DNA-cytosine methylase